MSLRVEMNNAGTRFTMLEPQPYPLWDVTVPQGYTCDLASIPPWLGSIWPRTGRYAHAAILHDYLYGEIRRGESKRTRATADFIFREQMKHDNVGWRTRWTFWAAVRLFGGFVIGCAPKA